jgi:hypothetical protein
MKYKSLLTITLKHAFYDNGSCPDFIITPNAETVTLLNNHRCVIKPNAYGLKVYIPTVDHDPTTPLISFTNLSQFSFDLNQCADRFALYSDSQKIEYSDKNGLQVYQSKNVVFPSQGFSVNTLIPNDPLLSLVIQRDFNQLNDMENADEIQFFTKYVLWVYFVVTDKSNNANKQMAIEDAEKKVTWTQDTPPIDCSIYAQLGQQFPDKEIIFFVSGETLACKESYPMQIQLKQDQNVIFDYLTCPSYQNFFQFNKAGTTEDAIYQVVKYLPTQL